MLVSYLKLIFLSQFAFGKKCHIIRQFSLHLPSSCDVTAVALFNENNVPFNVAELNLFFKVDFSRASADF